MKSPPLKIASSYGHLDVAAGGSKHPGGVMRNTLQEQHVTFYVVSMLIAEPTPLRGSLTVIELVPCASSQKRSSPSWTLYSFQQGERKVSSGLTSRCSIGGCRPARKTSSSLRLPGRERVGVGTESYVYICMKTWHQKSKSKQDIVSRRQKNEYMYNVSFLHTKEGGGQRDVYL